MYARLCDQTTVPIKPRTNRNSWLCAPIREELSVFESPQLDYELLKRHHRQRTPLTRINSAPQLISTTTTSPVHIHNLEFVFPQLLFWLYAPYIPTNSMSSSLMPRSDSFNARVRGTSHIDFKTATTGVAAKAMRNEISRLVATVDDPATKKVRPRLRSLAM